MSAIERLLDGKRARLERLSPAEALRAQGEGALLVDTRPAVNREAEGEIPGALVIDRNVLEWRLDPSSPDRVPEADSVDRLIVLFCNEGYASSLAAVQLQELGLARATDMAGGFRAWRARGLPTTEPVLRAESGPGVAHRG
ncbi:rhodanese-like domain-containing protein [Streptomonospora nanhaiensis]|uniref:Rhodanese-like domain-containing protein n=1 Tax=Streptomonospora nanhaiensis TaxID=1323731 RepID=A0ABY6YH86_9ACTN|nr:rhodanese-like domain-containing protein [Streptomonospora nanhaiensis]WAE71635.1 rhodanese-like domain-containing protein [Streptomonospora nanhaiensis]